MPSGPCSRLAPGRAGSRIPLPAPLVAILPTLVGQRRARKEAYAYGRDFHETRDSPQWRNIATSQNPDSTRRRRIGDRSGTDAATTPGTDPDSTTKHHTKEHSCGHANVRGTLLMASPSPIPITGGQPLSLGEDDSGARRHAGCRGRIRPTPALRSTGTAGVAAARPAPPIAPRQRRMIQAARHRPVCRPATSRLRCNARSGTRRVPGHAHQGGRGRGRSRPVWSATRPCRRAARWQARCWSGGDVGRGRRPASRRAGGLPRRGCRGGAT